MSQGVESSGIFEIKEIILGPNGEVKFDSDIEKGRKQPNEEEVDK